MTTKHTPGPWVAGVAPWPHDVYTVKNGWLIARTNSPRRTFRRGEQIDKLIEEQDANARLIAAAPELLEALKNLYTATPDNEGGELGHACMKARAAIAKAEGRE